MGDRTDLCRLRDLQTLLYALVTSSGTRIEPYASAVASLIEDGEPLDAIKRLEIYKGMYFQRLLSVFNEDFPATAAVLGVDVFREAVENYLHEYPPTQPSVYFAGRSFAEFLGRHPSRQQWPFIHELARLERALLDSFHAPDADTLAAHTMRAIAPSRWPEVEMRLHPGSILLEFQWQVSALLRTVCTGGQWSAPPFLKETVLVYRDKAGDVSYRTLESTEAAALAAAARGATFASICEAAAPVVEETANAANILGAMLVRWLADGILVRG
jgi:hypothetical protein